MANLAALRATVFFRYLRKTWGGGGGGRITAPPAVRRLSSFSLQSKNIQANL